MVMGGRSVFISYRRQLSWQLAKLVRDNLIEHDFETFVDHKNLDSGEFERTILSQIEAREHFIVLLEPGSLDRIGEDGDWLRREIAHALAHGRNVVPVTANGFQFRRDLVLPPEVARLPSFNGVAVAAQPEYFNAAMKRLRTQFLKMPSKPTAPPLPETRSVEQVRQALANPDAAARMREIEIELVLRELQGRPEAEEDIDSIIISGQSRKHYWTQCLIIADGFWCVAVSNEHLDPEYKLGTPQTSHLTALGWKPPEANLPNWWYDEDDAGNVAALMVRTLSEVYGVPLDKPLKILKSWEP
jgi:hypothetical protein